MANGTASLLKGGKSHRDKALPAMGFYPIDELSAFTVGWLITSQFLFFFDVAVVEPPIGYLSTGHRPSPGCVRPKPLRMRSSLSLRRDETNDIAEGVRKRRIRRSAQAVIRTMAC